LLLIKDYRDLLAQLATSMHLCARGRAVSGLLPDGGLLQRFESRAIYTVTEKGVE